MLHVVRTKSTIMGTDKFAFGFRRFQDATIVINKMHALVQEDENVRVWYTKTCPDKFVLTTSSPIASRASHASHASRVSHASHASHTHQNAREPFAIHSIPIELFLDEMIDSNLCVRLIDEVCIDHNFYTLYSTHGYEPYHTSEEATILLERQWLI